MNTGPTGSNPVNIDSVIDKCVQLIETLIPGLLLRCYRVGDDDNIMRASLVMLDYR